MYIYLSKHKSVGMRSKKPRLTHRRLSHVYCQIQNPKMPIVRPCLRKQEIYLELPSKETCGIYYLSDFHRQKVEFLFWPMKYLTLNNLYLLCITKIKPNLEYCTHKGSQQHFIYWILSATQSFHKKFFHLRIVDQELSSSIRPWAIHWRSSRGSCFFRCPIAETQIIPILSFIYCQSAQIMELTTCRCFLLSPSLQLLSVNKLKQLHSI